MRAETRKQEVTLFDRRGELVSQATQIFTILCMSMTDQSAMNTGFQVTNRLYLICKFVLVVFLDNSYKQMELIPSSWFINTLMLLFSH